VETVQLTSEVRSAKKNSTPALEAFIWKKSQDRFQVSAGSESPENTSFAFALLTLMAQLKYKMLN